MFIQTLLISDINYISTTPTTATASAGPTSTHPAASGSSGRGSTWSSPQATDPDQGTNVRGPGDVSNGQQSHSARKGSYFGLHGGIKRQPLSASW